MARTEVRKECPSCGLGVPLEAKVCEFCGWDFEEEDEWISQIEKLEQELITEKSKFNDTAVDKMIKSSLHSSSGEKPSGVDEVSKETPVVVKRKLVAKEPVKVKIARPAVEKLIAEREPLEEKARPAITPAPTASGPKSISVKINASKTAPRHKEFDLEKELVAREKVEIRKEEQAEKIEDEETISAAPKEEIAEAAGPPTHSTRTRRVRRVVSRPATAPGASPPVNANAIPAKSSKKPAPAIAAPDMATAPVKPTTPVAAAAKPTHAATAAPKKEEKKAFLGRVFGGEKEEKPEEKHVPSKIAPSKAAAPSKQAASSDNTPAQTPAPAKPQSKMFQCPLCNTLVKEEDKTCKTCGAEFE